MARPESMMLSVSGTGMEAQRPPRSASTGVVDREGARCGSSAGRYSLLEMDSESSSAGERGLERAKFWTPQVEDLYRLQFCGWRDCAEYTSVYGEPERWPADEEGNTFISKLQLKSNGYFTYWRKFRQCTDRDVFKVRIFGA
eukprot:CAMPEP_0179073866 /NCGR_PEP_ID=MMETSP0796-20121207/32793_1 /TAXON_ID=73915 /ORGANISM="Pyrodinium bahamense, Strain pbaha01" /LENGTH=141 /DNA_ID=CAMNT_0020771075 /DNA_START=10 /DNA_END=435 /DNA_ORIENTATION=-